LRPWDARFDVPDRAVGGSVAAAGMGDADLVYVTYGMIWFPVFLAFTLCTFLIYKQRRPGQWETWVCVWR
jgi:hypothetical protein